MRKWPIYVVMFVAMLCCHVSLQAAQESEAVRIPLKRAGNLFFLEATVDSVRGNFLLDLGAPYLVLNSTYFRNYEIDTNYRAGNLTSETNYRRQTSVERFQLYGQEFNHLQADVADLGHIEDQRKVKILGLVGVSFFKDYLFELNMAEEQLILHTSPATLESKSEPLFQTELRVRNDVICVMGKLNGKKLRFSLDTGAEMNVIHNDLPSKVYGNMEILETKRVSGAEGNPVNVLLVMLPGLELNNQEFNKMKTLVVNMNTMQRAYGLEIHGMLGYPFFSQGRFVIDFENKELSMFALE